MSTSSLADILPLSALSRDESVRSKASKTSSRDSIFSMLFGSVSSFLGQPTRDGSLPNINDTGESMPRLDQYGASSVDQIALGEYDVQDALTTLGSLPGGESSDSFAISLGSTVPDVTGGGQATSPVGFANEGSAAADGEDFTGSDADLCAVIDLAQLEEIVRDGGEDLVPEIARGLSGGLDVVAELPELGADDALYELNYEGATSPPSRGMSGEAVADLAAMLAHGGSSMDVLRTELDDLESDLAPDKSDGLAPPPSGLAGLASSLSGSFSLFPEGIWPSWAVGKHADETGDATVSPATSLSATSTVHAVPPSSLPLPVPKVSKSGQTSTASQASDKNGARNTLGRKEWTADEDQIIMSEVERVGQKWRVIAAKLPGRSDDAVRNRWKRLSAEAAGQANAVADALGILAPVPLPLEDGAGAADDASTDGSSVDGGAAPKPKPPPKPKAERLAWSKAEDAEIVRCVQTYGLKWGRISQNLPGRTAHAIRNRFHRLQQLQAEQAASSGQALPEPPPELVSSA